MMTPRTTRSSRLVSASLRSVAVEAAWTAADFTATASHSVAVIMIVAGVQAFLTLRETARRHPGGFLRSAAPLRARGRRARAAALLRMALHLAGAALGPDHVVTEGILSGFAMFFAYTREVRRSRRSPDGLLTACPGR
ncbi:hypothetical protein OG883_42345 [Streptomyces sp. NBC_01142]|uniref:hypothetical protein n=1 Tax=Streptomyces sp. NBC_01142 TaxID=2975865 RepID=UPI0022514A2D|nr:hypothetical protein [Streptomyces sp. NBC_01142]MCX4826288.1 hypothetical protein [Streptomyces sp. NBC_01142]